MLDAYNFIKPNLLYEYEVAPKRSEIQLFWINDRKKLNH